MKINPVNHAKGDTNSYCGPSAISIVTGMSSGEAARLLRHVADKASIKGTHSYEMEAAFRRCNIYMRKVPVKPQPAKMIRGKNETRPTMTQWLRDSKDQRTPGRVYLIAAGNHWQIVSGRRFCCGKTKQIVSITDKKANRRARVSEVWELIEVGTIRIPDIARKVNKTRRVDPCRLRLKKLERELGFKGKIVMNIGVYDYEVEPCPTFPHGFSTMHHDWSETYERVLHCTQPEVYAELAYNDYHYSA